MCLSHYKNSFLKVLVSISFILGANTIGFSQNYPYTQYTTREGLSQMQCLDVFEDSRGFVWVTTKEGFNRFDGERFKIFNRKDSLLDENNREGIVEDKNHNIFINNFDGLLKYDGSKYLKVKYPDNLQGYNQTLFHIKSTNDIYIYYYKIKIEKKALPKPTASQKPKVFKY